MDLLTAIELSLTHMRPSVYDKAEAPEARAARLHVIALSIDAVSKRAACVGEPASCKPIFSDRRTMNALLLAKGEYETHFAEYVHAGHCAQGPVGARCDADPTGVARAHGPWQQWQIAVFPLEDWTRMNDASLESTKIAAWQAARRLAGGTRACQYRFSGDPIASTIAAFAGSCLRMTTGMVNRQAARARQILATLPAE